MRTYLLFFVFAFGMCSASFGQMTLAHTYPIPGGYGEIEIVNLSNSGKKILAFSQHAAPDTLYFYNLDYSLWKKIVCPIIPGYISTFNIYDNSMGRPGITVFYPSESLFNTDTFLEAAFVYTKSFNSVSIFIINENGTLMDSITNGALAMFQFGVFQTSPGVFKATFTTNTGVSIYDLPGTIPCSSCSTSLGLAKNERQQVQSICTQPLPNPSANQVKITFTLPAGIDFGELMLYNMNGVKIKTYKIDNRFGYIALDNSLLPAGMYFYNIVANGVVSSTQKLVLLK